MKRTQIRMNSHFEEIRRQVDEELNRIFSSRREIPQNLRESMSYSIFAGGKRLRPTLVVAAAEAVGGNRKAAMPTAAAFEIIHTYTLIHDDLPIMDNDDLRRGLPTNHRKFGEAAALLAGDALLTLAFEILAEPIQAEASVNPTVQVEIIRTVAAAVGALGTVGGQALDVEYEGRNGDLGALEKIHSLKTGAMIAAAVGCGGLLGGASSGPERAALAIYGKKVGLAFQIIDDILDVTGEAEKLGKNIGVDVEKKKMTYPAVAGLEKSRKMGEELVEQAAAALHPLKGNSEPLKELARFISKRTH
ncbi:MAG: farnesyl-diphosphate synthase [bacterium]|nr:MAG: farnesyl-diphosphate synthase [bacterium]